MQHDKLLSFQIKDDKICSLLADAIILSAASKFVEFSIVAKLITHGRYLITYGLNVSFKENIYIFGPIAQAVDERISFNPVLIVNCGMVRFFAYLMIFEQKICEDLILRNSITIERSLRLILKQSESLSQFTTNA